MMFVHFAYCNPCANVLYCYRQGAVEMNRQPQGNSQQAIQRKKSAEKIF